MVLYYVANVNSVGIQGSFQDWEHLFDGKADADVQSNQILDCGDDEFVGIGMSCDEVNAGYQP